MVIRQTLIFKFYFLIFKLYFNESTLKIKLIKSNHHINNLSVLYFLDKTFLKKNLHDKINL
jgi:hypothetical protein